MIPARRRKRKEVMVNREKSLWRKCRARSKKKGAVGTSGFTSGNEKRGGKRPCEVHDSLNERLLAKGGKKKKAQDPGVGEKALTFVV